jgi:glycosyltransferase involved in cell wall biosynthesis
MPGEDLRGVAVVVPTLHHAGAERVAATLASHMASQVPVTVVTYSDVHPAAPGVRTGEHGWIDAVPRGCAYHHVRVRTRGPLAHAERALRIGLLIRRRRIDGVVSIMTYSNILVALARRLGLARFRHVASEHNYTSDAMRTMSWRIRIQSRLARMLYVRDTVLAGVSQSVVDDLKVNGWVRQDQRVEVVYNPVDVAEVRRKAAAASEQAETLPDRGYLVLVGRLDPQKGQDLVVRALATARSDALVIFVGDGPLREEVGYLATELGVAERVRCVGWLSNPFPVMAKARAVLVASRWEGFGLVAVEAAALDRPLMATRVRGLDEVCGVLGYGTLASEDIPALSQAIDALWRSPEAHKPRRRDLDAFSPDHIARLYLELLDG